MRRPNARFYRSTLAVSIPFVGGSAGFDLKIRSPGRDVDLGMIFFLIYGAVQLYFKF